MNPIPFSPGCRKVLLACSFLAFVPGFSKADEPIRIIVFGAHPDDCELDAGGTAARWAKLGHKVKFVSTTNGDIGHHQIAGGILARRRKAEVEKCAEILGIATEVLDNHDGELLPTLENRKALVKLIREWKADVVIGPRTNDYHPDHRYTGILVQDAAFMVIVPNFCPDIPALRKNPVFLYTEDDFKKPNRFEPDVVVPIDGVLDAKAACVDALESQFYEWNPWLSGYEGRGAQGEGRAARVDEGPGRQALRRDGREISRQAGRVARRGEGPSGEGGRGVRGLRVRLSAVEGTAQEAVPVLRLSGSKQSGPALVVEGRARGRPAW